MPHVHQNRAIAAGTQTLVLDADVAGVHPRVRVSATGACTARVFIRGAAGEELVATLALAPEVPQGVTLPATLGGSGVRVRAEAAAPCTVRAEVTWWNG